MKGDKLETIKSFNRHVRIETMTQKHNKKFMIFWFLLMTFNMVMTLIPLNIEHIWLTAMQLMLIGFCIYGFGDAAFKYKLSDDMLGTLNVIKTNLSRTFRGDNSEGGSVPS